MTRHKFAIGTVALGFALAAGPVWAQGDRGRPAGAESSGSAVSRPSGGGDRGSSGGGSTVGSSGSSGSSSSSDSSSGSSGGSTYVPAPSRTEAARERAPQHPSERRAGGERQRSGGDRPRSGEATGRAVPRGTSSGGDTSVSSGDRNRDRSGSPADRAVPTYSRPRDGRPVTGRAAERTTPIPGGDGYYYSRYPYGYYYNPYSYYGSYWYPGYSIGLGYFYYDPFWYGGYSGYGYGGGGYGYSGYGSGQYSYGASGSLRLKIKPRDAQVLVDGYFVGDVDSFDGMFQRLTIDAGPHKIEIRAPGYETVQFDVLITPGDTVTYKGDLERIK